MLDTTVTLAGGKLVAPYDVQHAKDFAVSNYAFYLPKIQTITDATYILDPHTSTKASLVPAQTVQGATNPLAVLRIGANGSASQPQQIIDNLTLVGSDQGHNYHGLVMRYGNKNRLVNSKFYGASVGDWNSPPGETFSTMFLRDVDTYISNVLVDGRRLDGTRCGGSPMGFNASIRPVIEDSELVWSLVSGLTFSHATDKNSPTDSPTTRRVRVAHNANTVMADGKRFTGFNHENVIGTITHLLPKIQTDAGTEWLTSHMFFGTNNPSAKVSITVNPDEIEGGFSRYMGALTLTVPKTYDGATNTQKLADITVVDQMGKPLTPYVITAPPAGNLPISKYTHFVINNS